MQKRVRKAIIPAAGYGTRFLPATKAQPKEMLPLVDKPIIQYVVEDAVAAGIEDIVIVTGWSKRSIEDHFDYPFELEKRLEEAGKFAELEQIRSIANLANFSYVRQKGPLGNGTAIWNCRDLIGDEPFLVLFGDDFIKASPSRSTQLIAAYERFGGSILGSIRTTNPDDKKRYGFASGTEVEPGVLKVKKMMEKPGPEYTDSNYAVVSGYLFEPDLFSAFEEARLRREKAPTNREFTYVDALEILLEQDKKCHAVEIQNGKYYDCGNKLEYLKAIVEFGLQRDDMKDAFRKHLEELLKQ